MGSLAIHCEPGIAWHSAFALKMQAGLKVLGVDVPITPERHRVSDIGILLGTTCWRCIEASGQYLLVDRASIGDPHFVQLVWNGHGRRGDHKVPALRSMRLIDVELQPWDDEGHRIVLCGQTESYSPHYPNVEDWYTTVYATHFRKHPSGGNPTGLPKAIDWTDAGQVITLNSSIGVESVLNGIPTITMDAQAMAWGVTGHSAGDILMPDRAEWLEWLSWTQWTHDEIEAGEPIRHLFEDVL